MNRPWHAWWDFRHHKDETMTIIVQTDHPKDNAEFIAEFAGTEAGIAQAVALMADINAGRVDVMKMIRVANSA